ncbi:MAG: TolC family protein [Candidatus Sericytochromatia bacterium]|nr:TolC family protein [Candidatus Tanganyikabacteria bacterium]
MRGVAAALGAVLALAAGPAGAAGRPITLEAALARAYQTHPDLAGADVKVAKGRLAIADLETQRYSLTARLDAGGAAGVSRIAPVTLAATGTFANTASAATPSAYPSLGGTLEFRLPLWDGGKTPEGLRALNAEQEALLAEREGTRRALTLEVIKAFWALRQADLAVEIESEAERQVHRTFEQAKVARALGRQTQNDVDAAEANWWAAQAKLEAARAAVGPARGAFAALLGEDGYVPAGEPPANPAAPGPVPSGAALSEALSARPDIRAARSRVAAAEAAVAAAAGDFWPQLAFSSRYQHGNSFVDPRSGSRNPGLGELSGEWDAQLSATYNLFDLGKTSRAVDRAREDLRAARASLEKLERQARAAIEAAAHQARLAATRVSLLARTRDLAGRNYQWVQTRKEQGFALAIQVDDALAKKTIGEHEYLKARIDYVLQMAELKAALGDL